MAPVTFSSKGDESRLRLDARVDVEVSVISFGGGSGRS